MIAWAQMGDANASIPTPQPVLPRPMFGAFGALPAAARRRTSSPRPRSRTASPTGWAVDRPLVAVARRVAALAKADLPENDALPRIDVDPDTFTVRIDGELIEPEPAAELPMAQRYFLF